MKNGLIIIFLLISFSAFSQKTSASAQQTITLKLSSISIVEKTQPVSTEAINTSIEAIHPLVPTVQVHSAKKWITKTNSISNTDASEEPKSTNDFIEYSEGYEDVATKIVTLSNI